MSTKQIHPYVRRTQQWIKKFKKETGHIKNQYTRKWWKAWRRTCEAEWRKEKESDNT